MREFSLNQTRLIYGFRRSLEPVERSPRIVQLLRQPSSRGVNSVYPEVDSNAKYGNSRAKLAAPRGAAATVALKQRRLASRPLPHSGRSDRGEVGTPERTRDVRALAPVRHHILDPAGPAVADDPQELALSAQRRLEELPRERADLSGRRADGPSAERAGEHHDLSGQLRQAAAWSLDPDDRFAAERELAEEGRQDRALQRVRPRRLW